MREKKKKMEGGTSQGRKKDKTAMLGTKIVRKMGKQRHTKAKSKRKGGRGGV